MIRWLRRIDAYKAVGIPGAILLIVFCFALMSSVAELYIRDLKTGLKDLHKEKASAKSLWLVSYYRLILERYRDHGRRHDEFLKEGKIQALLVRETNFRQSVAPQEDFLENVGISVINSLNQAMGTEPLRYTGKRAKNQLFELAYFLEHIRQFEKATLLYNLILTRYKNDQQETAYLYLHRGFCLSVAGQHGPAIADFNRVMLLDARGEMGITAHTLRYLLTEIGEKADILEDRGISLEKAESYFQLMSFDKAIRIFDQLEKNGTVSAELFYYRGRSFEESGKTQDALKDYSSAMQLAPGSRFAQDANRRLYMLGAYYNGGAKLKSSAEEYARAAQDHYFLRQIISPDAKSYLLADAVLPAANEYEALAAELRLGGIQASSLNGKIVVPDFQLLLKKVKTNLFRFVLKNGNVIVGHLDSETPEQIAIKIEGGILKIRRDEIIRQEHAPVGAESP